MIRHLILGAAVVALPGCIARAALDVATLPVKVASAGVDAVVTTQAESDRKRGARLRRQEECMGREARKARKHKREPDYERCDRRRG